MTYIRKKSQKQEKRTAKEFGGSTQIASGALYFAKGDVRTDDFLIENKFTDNDFFILKHSIWDKIRDEATRDGLRTPVMQVDIQEKSYIIIDVDILEELQENIASPFGYFGTIHTDKKSIMLKKDALILNDFDYALISFDSMDTTLGIINKEFFKILIDL